MPDNKTTSESVQKYFQENAASWLADAYQQAGYNYPTPWHRLRVVRQILAELSDVDRVMDIGCGGGQMAIALAHDGKNVTGIDESAEMLSAAREMLVQQPQEIQERVIIEQRSLQQLEEGQFDAIAAMGVVGYLDQDDLLFQAADRVLRPGGYALISFRNRLFNLFSISKRTEADVEQGRFTGLVDETAQLQKPIDPDAAWEFVRQLHLATGELLENRQDKEVAASPSSQQGLKYDGWYEARQSTPDESRQRAKQNGFETLQLRGIHPHWSLPAANKLLPPQVFNRISDSLLVLEDQPISLLWSSAFIGVFRKL